MGERGWEEAGERAGGALYGEKQSDGEQKNNCRQSAGWRTLGLVFLCTFAKWPRSPRRPKKMTQTRGAGGGSSACAIPWWLEPRGIAPKQITAMLCANERASYVLAPQMDSTFGTGGTSLLFFLSVIFSEGKTGDGVEGWWGSEDDKGLSRSSYVKKKRKKDSNSNNNFIYFIYFFKEIIRFCQFSN